MSQQEKRFMPVFGTKIRISAKDWWENQFKNVVFVQDKANENCNKMNSFFFFFFFFNTYS